MSGVIEQARYSCALAAQQTVLAIPGAHPIVHAGPGCSSKVSLFTTVNAGHQGEGYAGGNLVSSTNSCEQEVIFGGEKKLSSTIEGALQVLKGDLFVVMTGCTSDIVGDDSVGIARRYAQTGKPVVGVETAGFKGNSYAGHELVVNAVIEQFVGDVPAKPRKGLVNVFSVVPYQNPYWRGDLETLKKLLESIGLEAHVFFGYTAEGVAEWKDIPHAQGNLLVSPWVGLQTVNSLEETYGTPFLHYPSVPSGAAATAAFLRAVGAFMEVPSARVEEVIRKEEDRFYQYIISLADFIAEFRNNLPTELYTVADSAYAIGLSAFLVNEIGFIPKGVYITDSVPEQHYDAVTRAAVSGSPRCEGLVRLETDGGLIQRDIREKLGNSKKALFLGSSWEKALARETGNLYAFASLPLPETVIVNKTFLGFDGGLALLEDIYAAVFNTRTTTSRTQGGIEEAGGRHGL
jgi:nitrogenase molybdenum-iron protein beta chain